MKTKYLFAWPSRVAVLGPAFVFSVAGWGAEALVSYDTVDVAAAEVYVTDLSEDGAVIVGNYGPTSDIGFIWNDEGLRDLDGLVTPSYEGAKTLMVSADGSVIVGQMEDLEGAKQAFFLKDGVVSPLGRLPGAPTSRPHAVSADGSVVVGVSGGIAFRWESGQMTRLGVLPGDVITSKAIDVSADGSVVVGESSQDFYGKHAFLWENGQLTDLGVLDGEAWSEVVAVSTDGSTVIGTSQSADGGHSYRWKDGVMEAVGAILGWSFGATASAVSADGAVVVGRRLNPEATEPMPVIEAFRWEGGAFTDLQMPPEGWSFATGVSSDGSVVCGRFEIDVGRAVYWSEANDWKAVVLDDLLDAVGIDREGFALMEPRMTSDGSTLVGYAVNGDLLRLYRIRLSPAAEPLIGGIPIAGQEDWCQSDWFGIYCTTYAPWLFHSEHGFLYRHPASTNESMFVYDDAMGTWCWTSETVYPFIYAYDPPADNAGTDIGSAWLFYFEDSGAPRVFGVVDGASAGQILFFGP